MGSLNSPCIVLALGDSLVADVPVGVQRSIFFSAVWMRWFVRYLMKNVFLLPRVPSMKYRPESMFLILSKICCCLSLR